ncbi:MAG: histidine phosphatase family protein [Bacteroidetes bacterium]|nr:histidine phosphatase family protein [Rhodothermaceae bacterium RA]RMH69846.1 MAG: histidine phosphatase family protein [Bacteroidota bacterium]
MVETVFYFVRHGQTDYNRLGIVQGRGIDSRLNPVGEAQADALARRLQDVSFDAIYASTLRRALQTAEPLRRTRPQVPFYRLADLEEMSWGIYEGQPIGPDLRARLDAWQARWAQGCYDDPIDGGESILDVQRRALRAVEQMLDRHAGGTLLVVTHGRLLRVLLSSLLPEYGLARMQDIRHANTAVNQLVHRGDRFEARLLNCTIHLDADEPVSSVA